MSSGSLITYKYAKPSNRNASCFMFGGEVLLPNWQREVPGSIISQACQPDLRNFWWFSPKFVNTVQNPLKRPPRRNLVQSIGLKIDQDLGTKTNLVSEVLINLFMSFQVQNQTFQASSGQKFPFWCLTPRERPPLLLISSAKRGF